MPLQSSIIRCLYEILFTQIWLRICSYVCSLIHTAKLNYVVLITTIFNMLFLEPNKPCSLEVASVTSSSVTLQWIPPKTPNGLITHYSVHQYDGSVIDNNFGSKTLCKMEGTVEELSPDTEYVLQLRAYTKVGPGPPARLIIKTSKLLISQYKVAIYVIRNFV